MWTVLSASVRLSEKFSPLCVAMSRMRSSIGVSRRSSITNADGKRSSIGGNARAAARDPRPILDKGYVKDGVFYLSNFLRERGFEGACTAKELKQPSTLTVFNIFKFLIGFSLPRHDIAKLDEVPLLLVALGYHCKVNKSWLTAVGSPHAWPHLLAAMQWLCHNMECNELSDPYEVVFSDASDEMTMFPGEDEGTSSKQRRQEFHAESYRVFMRDGGVDVQESDYKHHCDMKEHRFIQTIQDLDAATERCQQGIHQASAEPTALQHIQKEVQCFAADKRKFEILIEQLEEHVHQQALSIQQKSEQLQDEEHLSEVLDAEKRQLEVRVASQPMSSGDVQRLAAESEQLCAERRDLRQKLDNLEKETWQAEMDCNKEAKTLAEDKQQILATGFDFNTYTFAAIQEQLLVQEDGLRRQRLSLQDEMERLRQMVVKQQEFASTLENDLKLSQATHKHNLQHLEDEYQREVSRSEQFRNALHSRLESKGEGQRLADAQDALRQVKARLEQCNVQCRADLKDMEEFLRTAMRKIADHMGAYESRVLLPLCQ